VFKIKHINEIKISIKHLITTLKESKFFK